MSTRSSRRRFLSRLRSGLGVVWPIASGLVGTIVALGIVIGFVEGWSLSQSVYFAFVTGLTIGFGDLVPKLLLTRALAVAIGFMGILLTALLAAVSVKALGGDADA